MIPFLIALLVFAGVGAGLTVWLRGKGTAPQAEAPRRGVEQLAQLRWRDFARLVLQTMHGRGYRPVIGPNDPPDGIPSDGSDILLERDGERALLSCQYGTGATVAPQVVAAAATKASLRGASRLIVVTPGRFEGGVTDIASQQQVELIDGETLWPEVRPYVAHPEDPVSAPPAPAIPPKSLAFVWIGAALAGALAFIVVKGVMPDTSSPPADEAAAPTAIGTATTSATPAAKPAATSASDERPALPGVPTDTRELDQRRKEAANAVATLFGVSRALWSSQSTLMVYLSSENADPFNDICPLLEQYPELAASRIQLQPPEGSDKPVRFKQCRIY